MRRPTTLQDIDRLLGSQADLAQRLERLERRIAARQQAAEAAAQVRGGQRGGRAELG